MSGGIVLLVCDCKDIDNLDTNRYKSDNKHLLLLFFTIVTIVTNYANRVVRMIRPCNFAPEYEILIKICLKRL